MNKITNYKHIQASKFERVIANPRAIKGFSPHSTLFEAGARIVNAAYLDGFLYVSRRKAVNNKLTREYFRIAVKLQTRLVVDGQYYNGRDKEERLATHNNHTQAINKHFGVK